MPYTWMRHLLIACLGIMHYGSDSFGNMQHKHNPTKPEYSSDFMMHMRRNQNILHNFSWKISRISSSEYIPCRIPLRAMHGITSGQSILISPRISGLLAFSLYTLYYYTTPKSVSSVNFYPLWRVEGWACIINL